MKNFASNSLIILGILLVIFGLYLTWQVTNPYKLSFTTPPQTFVYQKDNTSPLTLTIKKFDLTLPIYPASINGKKWDSTTKGISYLATSARPGSVGNSIFYGHNYTNILGKLPQVKPGDTIEIFYSDGARKLFEVQNTAVVSPDQTDILQNTSDRRVTIYTCTGFLDSDRFVVSAILKS